jgi:hypothetical protein
MAHTDTYKLSYYYGQKYNTTGYNDLLDTLRSKECILFDNRVNLVGEVFHILYDVHVSELCNPLVQDAVDHYYSYDTISLNDSPSFPLILEHVNSIMALQDILFSNSQKDQMISLATHFNTLVFEKDESTFYNKLMNILDSHTPFSKLDDIGEVVYEYWAKIKEYVYDLNNNILKDATSWKD